MALVELGALLAFVAALGIGVSNVAVDRGLVRIRGAGGSSAVFAAAFIGIAVSFVVFWAAALVRGVPVESLRPALLAPFLVAGVLYPALFRLLYYTGIDRIGVNINGAVVAANPAVAAFLAVPVLGERLTALMAVGIACIVGGGVLLQLAERGAGGPAVRDLILRELAGAAPRDFVYPLGALVVVGVAYVLIKLGLSSFPHPVTATAVTQTAGIAVFLGLVLWSRDAKRQLHVATRNRAALAAFAFAGLAVGIGWLGQFAALQAGSVVVVIPLVNTYPLVIAALSYGLARELPRSPRALAGIVAIIAGASVMQVT